MLTSVEKLLNSIESRILNNESTQEWIKENKILDFRGTLMRDSILYLISLEWKNLDDKEKEEIGINIAGIYNLGRFYTFMNNYKFSINE